MGGKDGNAMAYSGKAGEQAMVSPGVGSGTSGSGQAGTGDGNLRLSLGPCEE